MSAEIKVSAQRGRERVNKYCRRRYVVSDRRLINARLTQLDTCQTLIKGKCWAFENKGATRSEKRVQKWPKGVGIGLGSGLGFGPEVGK